MLAHPREGAVLATALLALAVLPAVTPEPAASLNWCGSVTVRVWPTSETGGSPFPMYVRVSSAYPEEIILASVRGSFAGSSTVYDWGSVIVGAYAMANLSQVVTGPDSGSSGIVFTLTGRAVNDTADIVCTFSMPYRLYSPGIPSTGFEGTVSSVLLVGSVMAVAFAVVVTFVWILAAKPPSPRGRPAPPLTRCPVCGGPLVPGSPRGFWHCARCGWQ